MFQFSRGAPSSKNSRSCSNFKYPMRCRKTSVPDCNSSLRTETCTLGRGYVLDFLAAKLSGVVTTRSLRSLRLFREFVSLPMVTYPLTSRASPVFKRKGKPPKRTFQQQTCLRFEAELLTPKTPREIGFWMLPNNKSQNVTLEKKPWYLVGL